ncbi:MAG: hypothetical protein MR637_02695 [Clostridiales bacterium]|nr:hypothetical protein [Clostridiales bacterium]
MNAAAAFSHREAELLEQLAGAQEIDQAIAACSMALEQTACELAQDEQDEHARQRQQAVMALARRAPQLLHAAAARGELVVSGEQAAPAQSRQEKLRRGARAAGAFLLAALAVYELIGGHAMFAVLQLSGGALLLAAGKGEQAAVPCQARGIPCVDAEAAVRMLRGLCQAADVCVSDLALLDKDAGMAHLTGTADDAMLDLLTALMEAKASGRSELAMRSLSQAEQYLHGLGIELIAYDAAHAQLFDVLPTMGEARTIRPAMMKDGKVLRRGVAALAAERSVGA